MNEKLRESVQYLTNCNFIENETFRLYETLSKKINQPESSFILGLAYDSMKSAKIIQGIIDCFDISDIDNKNGKKNLSELATEIMALERKISKINSLDYLISCETLKELLNLEDLLTKVYTNYLQSSLSKIIVEELSKSITTNFGNFKKVFEFLIEEKGKHRETIIEIMYSLEAKETEAHRKITPVVKYQNPDSWIHEATIHSFTNTPVQGNTEP